MARHKLTASEYTCDSCGATELLHDEDLPTGIHFSTLISVTGEAEPVIHTGVWVCSDCTDTPLHKVFLSLNATRGETFADQAK